MTAATCPCGQPAQMLLVGARCPECDWPCSTYKHGGSWLGEPFPFPICREGAATKTYHVNCGAPVLLALEPLPTLV